MPLKKVQALTSTLPINFGHATSWIPSTAAAAAANASSSSSSRQNRKPPLQMPRGSLSRSSSRAYATVAGPNDPSHRWPATRNPSPYDIFQQSARAPYSKARFYELVKIYHPDRHQAGAPVAAGALPPEVRLERYRLVVAAHELLSDPDKRRAYDLYGAGWGQRQHFRTAAEARAADRDWRQRPDSPCMNATWEDWEAWYQRQSGKEEEGKQQQQQQQGPLHMSNELFVVVLSAAILFGSFIQARRANAHSLSLVEMRDQRHDSISQDMRRRTGELASLDRHERVETFLRQREGWRLAESHESARPTSSHSAPASPPPAQPPQTSS